MFSEEYTQLFFYTLNHSDPHYFIHQHIVDAQTAQTADEATKPIAIIFALVGLYLAIEKNYTGREVQLAHVKLSNYKEVLPRINLPVDRGAIRVTDVLNTPAGIQRDFMIKRWCKSTWLAYEPMHQVIIKFCEDFIR